MQIYKKTKTKKKQKTQKTPQKTHRAGFFLNPGFFQLCLALDEGQIAEDEGGGGRPAVHFAEVGGRGEPGGQGHLQVALEAEEGGHQDEYLGDLHKDRPVLHGVQDCK